MKHVGVRFTASTLITALVAAVVFVAPASADKGKSSDGRDVAPSDAPATANPSARGQVVVRLLAPNQLQAITAQFGLDPTPIDQAATRRSTRLSGRLSRCDSTRRGASPAAAATRSGHRLRSRWNPPGA